MAIIQHRRSVEAKMSLWVEYEAWRRRREDLIREAQEAALAREARKVRAAFAAAERVPAGTEVRWGLADDEPEIADLLQLNGMPRWVAFEERFIVAERAGKLVGALRYRTESKRLILGLLVVDPWAGERRTAEALYSGARELARELGANEVLAAVTGMAYPREAGYSRFGRLWFSAVGRPGGDGASGRWRRLFGLWGSENVPFHRTTR
jgi:N-acetylglutamate synthase-like GNAT family acetyltransferase